MKKYLELFTIFFKIGLFTFGGGYVMFVLAQKEIVEKRKWATKDDLLDYYAIGTCTPGVIAVNVATLIGHKMKGKLGGVVATLGVISPSLIIATLLAGFLKDYTDNPYVISALNGIKIAVTALLAKFIIDLGKGEIRNIKSICIFFLSLILSYFLNIHIILIVGIAAILGYVLNYKKVSL